MVVNELYYGQHEVSARHGFPTSVVAEASGISISDDIIAAALRIIYRRDFNPHTDIEPNLFNAIAHTLNQAVTEGTVQGGFPALGNDPFIDALRHSTDVFSAFKVHRAQNDMAARLLDSNGNLKPFEQWKQEVLPIADHQCHNWLETEYNTAVLRARQAANWQQFQAEKDILPNLKWLPSTSPNPGEDHRPFWNTILPIDHPFWDQHRPGDRWNCKCDLTSTDEPPTAVPATVPDGSPSGNNPQPGLKDNPGKSQTVFSDDHPYFPADCKHCAFYNPTIKARLATVITARVKDCFNCPYIDGCMDRATMTRKQKATIRRKAIIERVEAWADRNLQEYRLPTGTAKRLYLNDKDGNSIIVNKGYFTETFAKNKRNRELARIMRLATMVNEWLPLAKQVRTEQGRHHLCTFRVFEVEFHGVTIEAKAKDNGSEVILYTMRIKE